MRKIDISESAFEYLQLKAVLFEDTTESVLDRIITEHKGLEFHKSEVVKQDSFTFTMADVPDVTFTSLMSAKVDKRPVQKRDWNNIFVKLVEACIKKDSDVDRITSILTANYIHSKPDNDEVKKGYRYIEKAGFSFQGLDAVRACKNLMLLSEEYAVPVELRIKWRDNPKAQFPGKSATIVLP